MSCALVMGTAAGPAAAAGPAWTTYRHDGSRSGIDPDSTSPVGPTQIWQTPALDGQVYGQPLVYGSTVYVATENDTVYALDAATGTVVWSKHVATPVPSGLLPCGNISPTVGITSTPVIDPVTGAIYVVANTSDGSNASSIQHKLFGLNLADGGLTAGSGTVVDPDPANSAAQLQRVSLALDAGKVIIGYGGNAGDCATYHGWLVAVPEGGGPPLQSFETNASTNEGAIWAAGNAPPVDGYGNIWTSTGNGDPSKYEYQESVVRLSPNLGSPLDAWAPSNWSSLDSGDADLGSSMPVLLPNGLVFQIGKAGVGYLLNAGHLGGIGAELYSHSVCSGGSFGGGIYVNGVIYDTCSGMRALSLGANTFSALPGWTVNGSATGPPVFAGGLVWSAGSNGTLYGLDPASGATKFSAGLGGFEHFTTPSAAGGNLFVASNASSTTDRVTAFHIANYTPPSPAPTPTPTPTPVPTPAPRPTIVPPKLSQFHVKVVGHKLRITFTLSKRATVTIRYGKRKWIVHARRGHDHFLLRWRKLSPGRHRLFVVARDGTGHASKRLVVHFQYRPKPQLRLF